LRYARQLEAEERCRQEQILERQRCHSARLTQLKAERRERIRNAQLAERHRIEEVAERRAKSEMSQVALVKRLEAEDAEMERRVAEIRHENKVDRMKKIAERQLLLRTMEENARALERRRQYEDAALLRRKLERERKAFLLMELRRLMARKKRDASIQTTFKRTEVLSEFREFMGEGGEPNLEALAKRFGLDLGTIRDKVERKRDGVPRREGGPASGHGADLSLQDPLGHSLAPVASTD
jgi:hypothetical protein